MKKKARKTTFYELTKAEMKQANGGENPVKVTYIIDGVKYVFYV